MWLLLLVLLKPELPAPEIGPSIQAPLIVEQVIPMEFTSLENCKAEVATIEHTQQFRNLTVVLDDQDVACHSKVTSRKL